MKTTLIGFGKCGEDVLRKCSDLTDTRFVLFSDAEAPNFVYQPQSPGELVITVSYARRTEVVQATGIRRDYNVNVSLVDIGLRASQNYNGQLNVEFVILPFKHIDMLSELHNMHADRNVVFVPEMGGEENSEEKYLSSCVSHIANDIHTLKCMADCAGYDEASLNAEDIHRAFGYGDDTYNIINSNVNAVLGDCIDDMNNYLGRYLRICPKRIVCQIITSKPIEQYQLDKLKLKYEDVRIGITKATEASKSVKLSYIAAFNWSSSDCILPFFYY